MQCQMFAMNGKVPLIKMQKRKKMRKRISYAKYMDSRCPVKYMTQGYK